MNAEDNGSQAPCSAHGVSHHKSNDVTVLEEGGHSERRHENPDKGWKTLSNYQLDRQVSLINFVLQCLCKVAISDANNIRLQILVRNT